MGVIKKHFEILWKKFLIVRDSEIGSKPPYQKGVGTLKTVIWNIPEQHFRTLSAHTLFRTLREK
ncbi:MAG: hypothetical protein CMP21_03385 [Rickettsiales bacterium]|nr:hypothetical protein [Rickettsiales bacterium]